MLKQQDIVLALELSLTDKKPTYAQLSERLFMSASELHAGAERLSDGGLLDKQELRIRRQPFLKFLEFGVPHVYPAKEKEVTRGIPTAWAAPVLKSEFADSKELPPVWADPNGMVKGCRVEPLYKSVPDAIKNNDKLYDLLCLVDAIRIGRAREKKIAVQKLKDYFDKA